MLGALALAILMSISAHAALAAAQSRVDSSKQAAADAVTTAAAADTVVATAADVIRDVNLSKAMVDHNEVYPKLYTDIKGVIPSFFRVTSMSAQPVDASTSTVILNGAIGSYQQYADLILALMRFKDAQSISRSGYNYDPVIVPPLTPDDPIGTPRKQDAQAIPQDQLQRLAYYQNQARPQGYQGVGNFGSNTPDTRGAMPGESLVTIVMTISRNLQTPDPQATLAGAGGAAAPAGGPGGFGPPAGFGGPGGPGGARGFGAPGAGGGTSAASAPAAAAAPSRKGGKGADDSAE